MRPATGGFSPGREVVSRYERPARGLRIGARFLAGAFSIRTGAGLGTDGEPVGSRGGDPKSCEVPHRGDCRIGCACADNFVIVDDVVSLDRALVFPVSKDRPVLLSALASAQALLTLDREDFMGVLGAQCYGLPILLPYDFLERERAAGRLPRL